MQALTLEHGRLALADRPAPEPGPGEACVRVTMAGICNTDIEIARGYMAFSGVLGHEFCGVVEACDDPSWRGARVAGEINLACGQCELCERGLARHCSGRTVLGILGKDGCFAQHVTLPVENLHRLPDRLQDERACFVEPTAAAFEILEQRVVDPSERIAVLGDGKLGLLIAQVLRSTGAVPTLVGRHQRKLALARAADVHTAELGALQPKSYDVVVEATGSPAGMEAAIALCRPRGTLFLKSTYHGALKLDAAPIVIDELCIQGSRCGPFEPAIAALDAGTLDPRPMIDAIYPFARALEAFEHAQRPGVLKVLLDMRD